MADPSKKIANPLLVASVTGGTFEEFSQNAMLLVAKEKPPPPVLALNIEPTTSTSANVQHFDAQVQSSESQQSHFQPHQYHYQTAGIIEHQTRFPPSTIEQQQISFLPPSNVHHETPIPLPSVIHQSVVLPPPYLPQFGQQDNSHNFSSVFTSFSNILRGQTQQTHEEFVVPAPAGIDNLIGQRDSEVAPIPLFASDETVYTTNLPPPQSGPVNTYRRSTLKKPAYVQVPGLSTSLPFNSSNAKLNNLPPYPTCSSQQSLNTFETFQPPVSKGPSSASLFFTPEVSSSDIGQVDQSQVTPNRFPNTFSSNLPFIPEIQSTAVMAALPVDEIPEASSVLGSALYHSELDGQTPALNQSYRPVYHHWFFKKEVEGKTIWQPFSMLDSLSLEDAFTSNDLDPDKMVPTDGGRFDVNILRRQRIPVYWKGEPFEVRRCSWFFKGTPDGRFCPYEENVATHLEEEYKQAYESNHWHRRVELPNKETVVFHSPDVLVLFPPSQSPDAWGNTQNQVRPRIVKRGMDEFDIDEGEPANVDHLLFLIHGIGSVCDFKFRNVQEVVDDFRAVSLQLTQSHYHSSCEKGIANRVEILPISWHDKLHTDTGIDKKLKSITLESIPRLREFTNDTLLDILLYSSPRYAQSIISAVGNQLNSVYDLFKKRNPNFEGGVSLGGHSLGSLILFDLLAHQPLDGEAGSINEDDEEEELVAIPSKPAPSKRQMSRRISYLMGTVAGGQPSISYPVLNFKPNTFFALGSPIGMFVTVRGLDTLGENFSLPTCEGFFNIFHPYDPVAYRFETLINPEFSELKPLLIPHHKGRKRMHLELKETMARVGADLKQRVIESVKSTWNSVYQLAMFHRTDTSLEEEVSKVLQEQLNQTEIEQNESVTESTTDKSFGVLNKGRRIDYVLQESPFEIFNEYLFALSSHVCYWDSEDTMLLILKEIYTSIGISADDQIPQQSMTIERPSPSPSSSRATTPNIQTPFVNIDSSSQSALGPPPMMGFIKKT